MAGHIFFDRIMLHLTYDHTYLLYPAIFVTPTKIFYAKIKQHKKNRLKKKMRGPNLFAPLGLNCAEPQTDGHGASMTELAKWGRFSEKVPLSETEHHSRLNNKQKF